MQQIAVVDYGMGNLRSVSKAVETAATHADVVVTSDPAVIRNADRVVCPGQGAARDCMAALAGYKLLDAVREAVAEKPFLGICMGMQVLLTRSDENDGVDCMNVIPGHVVRFPRDLKDANGQVLKVPHMGWSQVEQSQAHPLWQGIADNTRFYFAHSYCVEPDDSAAVVATCEYGERFAVALQAPHAFACQFHPEKSAEPGLQLLRNFTTWTPS